MRKGAIFDIDGTLFDSMGVWSQIDVDFLAKRGIEVPADYQEIITPMQSRDVAIYTIQRFGLTDTPEDLMQEWYDMAREAYCEWIPLKPGAEEYLRKLHAAEVHLAVASSSYPELIIPALRRTGIYNLFEAVVTAGEVSGGKTSPAIYLETARRMQVLPENCEVYEDIIEGIRTAGRAGFRTVGVYDASCTAHAEMRQEADRYVVSFNECLNWEGI